MVTVYKGKGAALDCGSYGGIKLLDLATKVFRYNSNTKLHYKKIVFIV